MPHRQDTIIRPSSMLFNRRRSLLNVIVIVETLVHDAI